jgi:regulatory protein YycH of two-component signal transduction system YycFG
MNREQIKTLILTILVIMSIIFTQKIWFYSPMKLLQSDTSIQEKHLDKIAEIRNQVIMPKSIIVSFGNNYYTKIEEGIEEVWQESKPVLSNYFIEEPEIIPTTYEKYRENSRLKSIELEFGKNVPSVLVSSIFDTVDNKIVSNVKEIKKILITASNKGIIYIIGKDGNIYFFYIRLLTPISVVS